MATATVPWFDNSLGQQFTVGRGGNHDGRDIQTAIGTPLTNLLGGVVTPHTGFYPWGGEVDIQTPSGITETWAHLDAIGVKPGQTIAPGQFIGLSGGENLPAQYSTGPHTHFSLFGGSPWDNSKAIDPTPLLDWAQQFIGGGPSSQPTTFGLPFNPNDVPGVQGIASGVKQAGGSVVNVTVNSALNTIMAGLGISKVSDFLWMSGLILLGGLLLLAGLIVFILPNRDQAIQAASLAAKAG